MNQNQNERWKNKDRADEGYQFTCRAIVIHDETKYYSLSSFIIECCFCFSFFFFTHHCEQHIVYTGMYNIVTGGHKIRTQNLKKKCIDREIEIKWYFRTKNLRGSGK